MLLFLFVGLLLLRFAVRQLIALLFQLPPRFTRFEPDGRQTRRAAFKAAAYAFEPTHWNFLELIGFRAHSSLKSRANWGHISTFNNWQTCLSHSCSTWHFRCRCSNRLTAMDTVP